MGINITGGYVSADGHVVEPADLWTTRMDLRFRDRAPRVESRPEGDHYVIDGVTPTRQGTAMQTRDPAPGIHTPAWLTSIWTISAPR